MPVLIDQGTSDEFLAAQLFPRDLQAAYAEQGGSITLRMQDGYDHSYHFIATFIGEHLAYHAKALLDLTRPAGSAKGGTWPDCSHRTLSNVARVISWPEAKHRKPP